MKTQQRGNNWYKIGWIKWSPRKQLYHMHNLQWLHDLVHKVLATAVEQILVTIRMVQFTPGLSLHVAENKAKCIWTSVKRFTLHTFS